jgi:hypothetical protein
MIVMYPIGQSALKFPSLRSTRMLKRYWLDGFDNSLGQYRRAFTHYVVDMRLNQLPSYHVNGIS